MNTYIIENFTELLHRGVQIVSYPLQHAYLQIREDTIHIFDRQSRYKIPIRDIYKIRFNTRHYTISLLFKDAKKVVLRLQTRNSLQLFYKYLLMLLTHKRIDMSIEDVL